MYCIDDWGGWYIGGIYGIVVGYIEVIFGLGFFFFCMWDLILRDDWYRLLCLLICWCGYKYEGFG